MKMNNHHRTQRTRYRRVQVYCPLIHNIMKIDERIVPLLKGIWRLGVFTFVSGGEVIDNWMRLEFDNSYHVEKFLWHIIRYVEASRHAPANIRERILGEHQYPNGSYGKLCWEYSAQALDLNEDADQKTVASSLRVNIGVSVSVGFPQRDYEFVLKAIEAAGKANAQS